MGWAKYMEDNLDYIEERWDRRERYQIIYNDERIPDSYRPLPSAQSAAQERNDLDKLVDIFLAWHDVTGKNEVLCRDCGRAIPFPLEKQITYARKGWNPPKRCKKCKSQRETRSLMRAAY